MIAAVIPRNRQYLIVDEKGDTICTHCAGSIDVLQGYTATTYTILRNGRQIIVFDEHGKSLNSFIVSK